MIGNNFRLIELTRGKSTLVDNEDFEQVASFNWSAHRNRESPHLFYARRTVFIDRVISVEILLHRFILGCTKGDGLIVDHRDGNQLNNQRSNLRICSTAQNAWNRTVTPNLRRGGFKGVTWNRACSKWQASIKHNGRSHYLGVFKVAEDAARAYDAAAAEAFGEFAALNFPRVA